ncbi:hypothetical protein BARBAKC583_1177 [Bartonella bacilliformis KC583]|uniref:Uncharacterized protein n=1 Tax=Bartonella bacilliformis (strain ATCC 35685 / KC583 / Herrer 020/F12,63) TaxID=360095 RepID=A1UTY2_BARBK|nr:hypothetical protein BARBAKC583_1177 [Bartonella bacilliformis KC583]
MVLSAVRDFGQKSINYFIFMMMFFNKKQRKLLLGEVCAV